MRNTDDPNPKPFGPLGERVISPMPPMTAPHSKPVGPYGVVTLPDGTMRTTRDNLPKGT